ncbi:UNVERIFIED_CONTAM: Retrovirus-related Pol polyprotein from transposon RE2 [Sesamum latifolium]|uniref:Retrovirus-related Pol polyprotein from transposon RE2 n=1 Tax=Sesamum latifolium TaxID=2727402 RepID=A0AAW2XJ35_9LAMI
MPCLRFFAFPLVPQWRYLPLSPPLWLFEVVVCHVVTRLGDNEAATHISIVDLDIVSIMPEWANDLSSEPNVSIPETDQVSLSSEVYERLIHQPVANSTSSTATPAPSPGIFVASHGKLWLLDSGATTHITANKSYFTSLSMSALSPVRLVDDTRSPVSGSGIVHPSKDLTLDNVFFALHFFVSLMSISQLHKSLNCLVTFFPSYCVFQDLQTKKTIGGGYERDSLYYLDTTTTPVSARALSASISPFQWHCCLGHPSLAKLKQLLPLESSVSKLECESCELGKHHRVSCPSKVNNCSLSPFDLVPSDTMLNSNKRKGFTYIEELVPII